jgi:hypothetical protein
MKHYAWLLISVLLLAILPSTIFGQDGNWEAMEIDIQADLDMCAIDGEYGIDARGHNHLILISADSEFYDIELNSRLSTGRITMQYSDRRNIIQWIVNNCTGNATQNWEASASIILRDFIAFGINDAVVTDGEIPRIIVSQANEIFMGEGRNGDNIILTNATRLSIFNWLLEYQLPAPEATEEIAPEGWTAITLQPFDQETTLVLAPVEVKEYLWYQIPQCDGTTVLVHPLWIDGEENGYPNVENTWVIVEVSQTGELSDNWWALDGTAQEALAFGWSHEEGTDEYYIFPMSCDR